jgi:hypothetical protein
MTGIAARAAALFVVLLTAAAAAFGATASDFYLGLLRRGIANYDAGRFEAAARELDLAAFGLIESVDHFETAKIYAALANDKLGRATEARSAAMRVVAAERVQRRFGQISLPNGVRTGFVAVARKHLTAPEVAALTSNAPVPAATTPTQPRVTTTPGTRTPATTPANPAPTRPQTQPQTQPQTTQPQTTQPKVTTPSNPPAPQPQVQPQVQPPPVQPPVQAPVTPVPQPQTQRTEPVRPQPAVEQPKVEVPKPEPAKPEAPKPKPEAPKVVEQRTVPFPSQSSSAPQPAATAPVNVASRMAEAERLLSTNNLMAARAVYRELIETNLDRAAVLAVAEGSYRARDFATTVKAIDRAGKLGKGEEPYRYYLAVALYETGNHKRAKRELAAALPHIQINESVARYRAKIEGAID